ncbi:hypothetical protein SARC_07215 [Sphaeroforma arctica JP610]|uniref:Glucosamine inositolphosphorylceramide transferase 1 N-terminal domain-containing protein n=1 Tax=Sphaeroforma arctica JP610 TaxID=667725 RepID=A0A0L0FUC4_9EUKA|nr:hypothetical protein SARC_07215 [Sphaeroforma arctica JP610]KNC80427.1 hypothetical protein SARC_07215 [Sphaeroforma arctica JP610]|eukprot:XP_014154329.1 hypothetical protein SARC_07215 [Sphaeroforma arctica JP610]
MAYGNSPFNLTYADKAALTCSNIKDIPAAYVSGAFILPPASLFPNTHPGSVTRLPDGSSHKARITHRNPFSGFEGYDFEKTRRKARRTSYEEQEYSRHLMEGEVRADEWLMFFEVKNNLDYKGGIGLARSSNAGGHWVYDKIVLDEYFQVAFPFVFRVEGDLFMIPSTREINQVRLYRATSDEADEWEHVSTLLSGRSYCDTNIVYYDGQWWMYSWTKKPNELHLYYSEWIEGPWNVHPMSPLDVKKHDRRPGGRPVVFEGKVIRYSVWGTSLRAFQVDVMNTTHYEENKLKVKIKGDKHKHWISKRVHTVDPHELSPGVWVAGVDGDSQRSKPVTRMVVRWAVLSVVFSILAFVVMKVNLFKPAAKSIRKLILHLRGHKRQLQQWGSCTHLLMALCVWIFGLWRLDWLLDCREPYNVAHFQGIGTLCLGDVAYYSERCLEFVERVNVTGMHGHQGLKDVYSPGLSIVGNLVEKPERDRATGPLLQGLPTIPNGESYLGLDEDEEASESAMDVDGECEITVITAMIDLSPYMKAVGERAPAQMEAKASARGYDIYKTWFKQILGINACMVVYVKAADVEFVWQYRSPKTTVVSVVPNDVVETYKHIGEIEAIVNNLTYTQNVRRPDRIEMRVPAYSVTQYKKIDWVYEATVSNPFGSDFFFWVDGGYGHGKRMPDLGGQVWPNPDKVRSILNLNQAFIIQVDDPVHEHCFDIRSKFMRHESTIAGGFFGGTKASMHKMHSQFHRHLETALEGGYMDDDQAVFFSMWCESPSLFQLERCPANLLCKTVGANRCFDRWNCAPQFFANGGLHDFHIWLYQWIGT